MPDERPSFPPEVWSLTIPHLRHRKSPDDLTYLWSTVRHVNRLFQEKIEELFRTEHLPKTWLHFSNPTNDKHLISDQVLYTNGLDSSDSDATVFVLGLRAELLGQRRRPSVETSILLEDICFRMRKVESEKDYERISKCVDGVFYTQIRGM